MQHAGMGDQKSGQHPATWEKKGSALFTTINVEKYRQVRTAANRILNKIRASGGHVFYVGLEKNRPVAEFKAQALYLTVLGEAMKRLNQFADQNDADMVIVMDEHQDRDAILTAPVRRCMAAPRPVAEL
jgi:Cdc6-like AAA superfamily ATPase